VGLGFLPVDLMFGLVALFEADRVAQSSHRFLEIAVLDGMRGHQRVERLGDDVELFLRGLSAASPRTVHSWPH